ncbi:beta-glucuronidase [Bacteroidia bacterium]|nr:beta-glucuronidase [Bacteroidia bacterium]
MKRNLFVYLFVLITVSMMGAQPRSEYPRPQFERQDWVNLNGEWSYVFDFGKSGKERDYQSSKGFDKKITVPFPPESKLSGVEFTDFIENMWYQRSISIPSSWNGKDVYINFGAVYYACELFIDGTFVGRHFGGSSSFSFDLTPFVEAGKTYNIVLNVTDDLRGHLQTGGKQHSRYFSGGCSYTRTTGIWQTVWLEAISPFGLRSAQIIPDLDQEQVEIHPLFIRESHNATLKVTLKDGNKVISQKNIRANNTSAIFLPVPKPKTWSPESPFLYDLTFEVIDAEKNIIDKVESYVGIRKISIDGQKLLLNNQPYFQRLVLDQGFYPDGIWTAPSDEALKNDILLSKAAGFNGARLHQKVFEERFHYWADKLGYLTWGEEASWEMDVNNPEAQRNYLSEWTEIIIRDRNYPSIVAWTPFNEVWGFDDVAFPRLMTDLYKLTKGLDPTRLFVGSSGGTNFIADIFTAHNYEGNPERLKEQLTPKDGKYYLNRPNGWNEKSNKHPGFLLYDGKIPYCLDEFGGIKWVKGQESGTNNTASSWGYGDAPKSKEELYTRLEGLVDEIIAADYIWGYCYTQLTDVEQEQNGVYYYDRSSKFDMDRINKIFSKTKK